MRKITPFQERILSEAATDPHGASMIPAGYSKAGADASRWARSIHILVQAGLMRRPAGSYAAYITPKGIAYKLETHTRRSR